MNGLLLTLLLGLFIIVGALIVFLTKNNEKFIEFSISLAFGVMITLILIDILPEVIEVVDLGENWKNVIAILGGATLGFLLLTLLDKFIPFGETEPEILDAGELVYAVGDKVRTRRWIWRQSEEGKIVESTKNIFFPIDGFKNSNYDNLMAAREELASLLKEIFDCEIKVGFIDKDNREFEMSFGA